MSAFFRLPIIVPETYGTIPLEDINPFGSYTEIDAWEHWIFDVANSSALIGKVHNRTLAVQSAHPAYSLTHLTTPTAQSQGLVTSKTDTATAVETWCIVLRPKANIINANASDANIFLGNLDTPANPRGGSLFLEGATGYPKTIRVNFMSSNGDSMLESSQNTNFALSADTWYFIALTRNFSGPIKTISVFVGGQSTPFTLTSARSYTPGLSIGIANNYWQTTPPIPTPGNYDFAEFIVFDSAKSSSELQALYARRKSLLANKGIYVV